MLSDQTGRRGIFLFFTVMNRDKIYHTKGRMKRMAGGGYGRENQRKQIGGTAPDDGGSLFFPEIYCAFDGACAGGDAIRDNFWALAAKDAKETENTSTDRGHSFAACGLWSSGGIALGPFFLGCRKSAGSGEPAGFTGAGTGRLYP